jgi:outer membrane beta-barrel protein
MRTEIMQTSLRIALVVMTALAAVGVGSESASAQEVQISGPLAGAPACHHCRIYREGRFQLQPFVGFTLTDEFVRSIPLGIQIQYHFTEWLGVGLWGAWAGIGIDTGLTDEITTQGQTTNRNRLSLPASNPATGAIGEGFPDQIGRLSLLAAVQLEFIPLRGKLSLFQKLFIDADFYIAAGFALVNVEERAPVETPGICDAATPQCMETQTLRESRWAPAPTVAVGLMLYATDFFGVSFEWRAIPFAWNTSGTDEDGFNGFPDGLINDEDQVFHLNHMVNIGFAFMLPPTADVTE